MTVPLKIFFCPFSVCNKISLSFYERKCLVDIFFERWFFHLRATKIIVVSLFMKATVWIYLIIAEIIDQYFIFWLGRNVALVNFRLIVFLLTIYSKYIQSKTKCNFFAKARWCYVINILRGEEKMPRDKRNIFLDVAYQNQTKRNSSFKG